MKLPNEQTGNACRQQGNQNTGQQHVADIAGNELVLVIINQTLEAADNHTQRGEVSKGGNKHREYALHVLAELAHDVLYAEHNNEFIRNELRTHVLCQLESFPALQTHKPGKGEHDAAEDVFERNGRMNQDQKHIDEFCQGNESDNVSADDEYQTACTQDGVTEEGEERFTFCTIIIYTSNSIFFFGNLNRMKNVRNDKCVDNVQRNSRDDEFTRHHLGVNTDHCSCNAAHGHHGKRQTAVRLHALELEVRDGERLRVAEEHHFDSKEGFKHSKM